MMLNIIDIYDTVASGHVIGFIVIMGLLTILLALAAIKHFISPCIDTEFILDNYATIMGMAVIGMCGALVWPVTYVYAAYRYRKYRRDKFLTNLYGKPMEW